MLLLVALIGCGGKLRPLPASASGAGVPERIPAGASEHLELLGFKFEGAWRSVFVSVPETLDESTPVVVAIHGGRGEGSGLVMARRFGIAIARKQVLLVFPNGSDAGGASWVSYGHPVPDPERDVRYLSALFEQLHKRYGGSPETTTVAGFSNGGLMTWTLACEAPQHFARVLVVGKPVSLALSERCEPEVVRPLVYVQGNDDPNRFGKEGFAITSGATRDWWAAVAGCGEAVEEERERGLFVRYDSCAFWASELTGLDHGWPPKITARLMQFAVAPEVPTEGLPD